MYLGVGRYRAFEAVPQHVLGQVSTDEDEPRDARFISFPRALTIAFQKHVNGLDDKSVGIVLESKDALHPHDVDAQALCNLSYPGEKARRVQRTIARERKAGHPFVMFVGVVTIEKIRLDFENPAEAEGVALQNHIERDSATLSLMDDCVGFIARMRLFTARSSSRLTRSVLLTMTISAKAICSCASCSVSSSATRCLRSCIRSVLHRLSRGRRNSPALQQLRTRSE